MICSLKDPSQAAPLFSRQESGIVQGVLSGSMGGAYADTSSGAPKSALCMLGDFAFYGGKPCRELLDFSPDQGKRFAILVPENEEWRQLILRHYGAKCTPQTRYAFSPANSRFCPERLQACVAALPPGYRLQPIDRELYPKLLKAEWSRDFVSLFHSGEDYAARGLGFVALYEGEPVGGASSYSVYPGGVEIETDVVKAHQKKGVAAACCAALILACLQRGLYPDWDAATPVSVRLAKKLGYHDPAPYAAFHTDHFAICNSLHNEHSPAQFD